MTEITGSDLPPADNDAAPAEAENAAPEAPAAPPEPTHDARPDHAQDEPPTDDGLNHMGYYRRPNTDDGAVPGSTIIVMLGATPTERAGYEAKGFVFEGYVPAE